MIQNVIENNKRFEEEYKKKLEQLKKENEGFKKELEKLKQYITPKEQKESESLVKQYFEDKE